MYFLSFSNLSLVEHLTDLSPLNSENLQDELRLNCDCTLQVNTDWMLSWPNRWDAQCALSFSHIWSSQGASPSNRLPLDQLCTLFMSGCLLVAAFLPSTTALRAHTSCGSLWRRQNSCYPPFHDAPTLNFKHVPRSQWLNHVEPSLIQIHSLRCTVFDMLFTKLW